MLRALGANVMLAGVVGNDADGERIRQILMDLGIDSESVLVDASRPSTVKERYIGRAQARHPQQMIRVDYEVRTALSAGVEADLMRAVSAATRSGRRGAHQRLRQGGLHAAVAGIGHRWSAVHGLRTIADPIRGHDYRKYHGCSAITPNRLEAGLATGRVLADTMQALEAAAELRERLDLEAAIVTLDKEGMALVHADGRQEVFPTRPRQVYDITGAGDMVMSVLGMALAAGVEYAQAIRLANIAGGLEVEKIGVATVTRDEILHDLLRAGPGTGSVHSAGLKKIQVRERFCTISKTDAVSASASPLPTVASTCSTPATCSICKRPRLRPTCSWSG